MIPGNSEEGIHPGETSGGNHPSLDLRDILQASSIEVLAQREEYRHLARVEVVARLRERWRELCLAEIKQIEEAPGPVPELDRLDEIRVVKNGVTYAITGVIHGLIGGGTQTYRNLIQKTLKESNEYLLLEAGFNHLYGEKGMNYCSIPDFQVLSLLDTMKKGFDAGRILPYLLFELLREVFSAMPEDSPFHTLHQEVRRGMEGVLPTHLEVEWDRLKPKPLLSFEDYPNIVRRSAFMSAFAEEIARKRGLTEVRLVVGDFHLTETAYFLNHPEMVELDLRHLADKTTSADKDSQAWGYFFANLWHNGIAGMAGMAAVAPFLVAWIILQIGGLRELWDYSPWLLGWVFLQLGGIANLLPLIPYLILWWGVRLFSPPG